MKPIIVDLKDISDSTEVYDSKPNRFVPYTIYIICAILAIALIWMYLFRMDIVVKADSVFRGDDDSTAVSCAVTGKITKMSVKDGQYVNEGDELYEVDIENLGSTIEDYKSKLDSVQQRLDMLNAYQKSLDGDNSEFDAMSDNQYYSEFKDRKELLNTSIDAGKEKNKTGEVYDENITVINDSIDKYNEKINKLNNVKQCIISRNNTFDQNDTYYYSIVKSYISSYDYTALQYDNKKDETTMDSSQLAEVDTEKNQALSNLESNEISTIEQQIETANEQIESLKSNISSVELQKKQTENSNNTDESDIKILTEKGNVSAEILTYEDKKQEYEAYLKDYDIKNNNCTIKAGSSGYFYTNKEISNGTYIQEGDSIGQIYTGEKQYSGTGRNARQTNIVREFNAYSFLPIKLNVTEVVGERIDICCSSPYRDFFTNTRTCYYYASYFSVAENSTILGKIKGTDKVVAAVIPYGSGKIVLLPQIYEEEEYKTEDVWKENGKKYLDSLFELNRRLKITDEEMDLPGWAQNIYILDEKVKLKKQNTIENKIAKLEKELDKERIAVQEVQKYKLLLTSSGTTLEEIVKQVLDELGFTILEAEKGRSDIIAKYGEVAIVAEIKGVTKSAAEKHAAQLEKWVAQYIEENEVSPKGMLIVNGFCDMPLNERLEDVFPQQMLKYCVSRGHVLLTSTQLLCLYIEVCKNPICKEERITELLSCVGKYERYRETKDYLK